jgi:hypothetical protein
MVHSAYKKRVSLLLSQLLCSVLFIGLYCEPSFAQGNSVQVYKLHHQIADSLLPSINSVLRNDESVNAYNNDLVVNASSATHQQIQTLLQQLDTPSRNLMISVQNNNSGDSTSDNLGASGGIKTGKVYLGTGKPITRDGGLVIRHDGAQIQTNRTVRSSNSQSAQQVRAVEGYPSWISAGQSAPVRSRDRYGNPTTEYVNADQGFYVTARIVGERVMLEVSTTNDTFSNEQRGVIDTQRVHTSVTGAIGEWISLGTIQTDSRNQSRDYTSRNSSNGGSVSDIAIRVVPVN